MNQYYLVYDPATNRCYPTGVMANNGRPCSCARPKTWNALPPEAYQNDSRFRVLSQGQLSQVLSQVAGGASTINNTFGNVDLPNQGVAEVSRLEGLASPAAQDFTYTIVMNNLLGATTSRVIIGDWPDTYALLGNTQSLDAGFVVGGTFATAAASHFTQRTEARPWSVKSIWMQAVTTGGVAYPTWFTQDLISYFDTRPNADNPIVENLSLSKLVSADQFNPNIQKYDRSMLFDGTNGLDVYIPAAVQVTFTFTISAERGATNQVLLK